MDLANAVREGRFVEGSVGFKVWGWRELRRAVNSYKESNWWKDLKKVWLSEE